MASPFRIFRKYLKPLMVFFGVLIMFAFVILDPLASYLTGGRGGDGGNASRDAGAVAASWEGGSLTNQELENLVDRRAIVRAFHDQVEILGAQSALRAGIEPSPLRIRRLELPEEVRERVERSVVQTKLFADAAREAGMAVDDNAIVQYLLELGRGRVTRADMRSILQGSQNRVSIDYVFDGLRDEMLAQNYFVSNLLYAGQTVTPQQRWQDWLRVNDRIVVEAAALPAESYLIEVKDPSVAELKKFYDEHKDDEAGPDIAGDLELPSARPGFREPRKIDVQYVQANFNNLVTQTEGEITEEEIAKYYEENKDRFIKADRGLFDDLPTTPEAPPSEDAPSTEVPVTETPPVGEDAAGKTEASDADASADATNESDAATETPAADEAPPQTPPESPPSEPSSETPPATEPGGEPATPSDADQSSRDSERATNQSAFRQVAFLQEQDAKEGETPKATAPTDESDAVDAEAPPAADTAPTDDAAPGETADPAAAPPDDSTDSTATTDAPKATDATTDPGTPATTSPDAETPKAAEKPPEYEPLDQVRDVIRVELARRRADELIATKMDEVHAALKKEFNAYFNVLLDVEPEKDSKKTERPAPHAALADLAPLADKYGLTVGRTGPMSYLEFRETPLGRTIDTNTGSPLAAVLFGPSDMAHYQPVLTVDAGERDRYVSMKASDAPSRVPQLAEVEAKVKRTWKLREAAKFALKDAEKQAAQAQKTGSSLAEFYKDKPAIQVENIDPFSYLTRGDVPGRPDLQRVRLSQPDGLVAPGPKLLEKVFDLKDGEVGAALNHDESIAYVLRVVEHQDTPDELRTAYLAEANRWEGLAAMTEQHFIKSRDAILADITGPSGIDWKRDPDQVGGDSDEDTE